VVFIKGKTYKKHVSIGQVKQINVRVENVYKLEVDACTTLSSKKEHVQG